MNFPVELVTDMPMWYNWIGNIGAIAILVFGLTYAIFYDDYDGVREELGFTILASVITIIVATCWAMAWGLLVFIIPGVILYGIRRGYWSIKDWIYYWRYDR